MSSHISGDTLSLNLFRSPCQSCPKSPGFEARFEARILLKSQGIGCWGRVKKASNFTGSKGCQRNSGTSFKSCKTGLASERVCKPRLGSPSKISALSNVLVLSGSKRMGSQDWFSFNHLANQPASSVSLFPVNKHKDPSPFAFNFGVSPDGRVWINR